MSNINKMKGKGSYTTPKKNRMENEKNDFENYEKVTVYKNLKYAFKREMLEIVSGDNVTSQMENKQINSI